MKYEDMTRVQKLEELREAVRECKREFTDMDWNGIEERIEEQLKKEYDAANYWTIYRTSDGQVQEILFDGPEHLCDQYMENRPHLKGHVIRIKTY